MKSSVIAPTTCNEVVMVCASDAAPPWLGKFGNTLKVKLKPVAKVKTAAKVVFGADSVASHSALVNESGEFYGCWTCPPRGAGTVVCQAC